MTTDARRSARDLGGWLAAALLAIAMVGVIAPSARATSAGSTVEDSTDTGPSDGTTTTWPSLRRAALRLAVSTTSDWVQVDLPGVSAGHQVVAGSRTVRPTDRGVVVTGPAKVAGSVTVDVVVEVEPTVDEGWISVTQGGAGKSTVEVLNRTADVFPVATTTTSWSATRSSVRVAIDALIGPEQLEWVRADDERRVLAFTYPWFGDWAKTDDRLSVHPTDPWISSSAESALLQATRARAHGIDGFVMSFAGAAKHGLPLHHSLAAAEQTGGTATILLETGAAGSSAEAERWLAEALEQSDHPAFMRLDGIPVVFTFASGSVPAAEWAAIAHRLAAAGRPVHLISDSWTPDGAATGLYRYNALLQSPTDEMTSAELTEWNRSASRRLRAAATLGSATPGVVVATVQPGWHRKAGVEGEVVIDRQGGETYDSTWRAALAAEPDWVVVTSWEEWYEGTGIAPSSEHGTSTLEATDVWADRFHR